MSQLTFITPQTTEELAHYSQPLAYLLEHWGAEGSYDEWLVGLAGIITFVYMGELLVGAFTAAESRHSTELHGIYSPWFEQRVDKRVKRAVKRQIDDTILKACFKRKSCKKVVTKVPKENKLARIWCSMMGFKPLKPAQVEQGYQLDKGRIVYTLERVG